MGKSSPGRSKEKRREYQKRYYEKNRAKILKRGALLNATPERQEYMREYGKAWAAQNKERRHLAQKKWHQENRDLVNARARVNLKRKRKEDPDRYRAYMRKFLYGISREQYESMVTAQNGLCAICQGPPVGKPFLLVDHDHVTGKVRALLCQSCNVGLGHLKDSIPRLESALAYLRLHQSTVAA